MNQRISLSSAVGLALVLVACGGAVASDPNGTGDCDDCGDDDAPSSGVAGSGAGSRSGGSSGPSRSIEPIPAPTSTPAPTTGGIALRNADLPPVSGGSGTAGSGGESTIDPQTMNITLGSPKPVCQAPFAGSGCGHWNVNVGIPPELLVPGVLELGDSRLVSFASFSGPDRGDGTCYGGGGSYFDGTIEIVSIDAERIVVRLADTWTSEFDANGEHTADRCN